MVDADRHPREVYPDLYSECFDFSVPLGWLALVSELSGKLGPAARCVQVKSKFGGLRFYCDNLTPEDFALVSKAEAASTGMCERCGARAERRVHNGWIATLCDGCNHDGL